MNANPHRRGGLITILGTRRPGRITRNDLVRASVAGALVSLAVAGVADAKQDRRAERVTVCHSQGNAVFRALEVSEYAVPGHERHGDGLPGDPVPGVEGYVFGETCGFEEAPPVVMPGFSGLTGEGSVRFRQQSSGGEVYLGRADLGVGGNRVEAEYTWPDGTYAITFSFNGTDTISTTVNGSDVNLDYAITPTCSGGAWDTMDILVVDRSDTGSVQFNNVVLEGFPLGDFGTGDVPTTSGFENWTVTAFDFSQAWTLTGDLVVTGFSGSAELNKVQLTVGCLP